MKIFTLLHVLTGACSLGYGPIFVDGAQFPVVDESVNTSSWLMPACFEPCVQRWCPELRGSANISNDVRCLCAPDVFTLIWDIDQCLIDENCQAWDYFAGQRIMFDKCDVPKPAVLFDNTPSYVVHSVTAFSIETIFLALRLSSKAYELSPWALEDLIICIAWLFSAAAIPLSAIKAQVGDYYNLWTLDWGNWKAFATTNTAYYCTCALSLGLVKLSVTVFYMQLFHSSSNRFRRLLYGTAVFICLFTLSFVITLLVNCIPFSCIWNPPAIWKGCQCNHSFDIWEGQGPYPAINAALDVWLMLLPAREILKANWSRKQKLRAGAMFCLGFLTLGMALMRFVSVRIRFTVNDGEGVDPFNLQLWYFLEVATAFAVACAPAARLIIVRRIIPFLQNSYQGFMNWLMPYRKQNSYATESTMLEVMEHEGKLRPVPDIWDVGGLLQQTRNSVDDGEGTKVGSEHKTSEWIKGVGEASLDGSQAGEKAAEQAPKVTAAEQRTLRRFGFVVRPTDKKGSVDEDDEEEFFARPRDFLDKPDRRSL